MTAVAQTRSDNDVRITTSTECHDGLEMVVIAVSPFRLDYPLNSPLPMTSKNENDEGIYSEKKHPS